MHAVIIFESMYGNTHAIAGAIGRGLGPEHEVSVVPVAEATAELLDQHGLTEIAPAQSFLVKDNKLQPGEEDRAEQWGRELAAKLPAAAAFL